jgi:hypothetical protein
LTTSELGKYKDRRSYGLINTAKNGLKGVNIAAAVACPQLKV